MLKPILVVVADKHHDSMSRQENPERLAIIYNCQTELDCEVISDYTSTYALIQPEVLEKLTQLIQQERLVAIIVTQGEYDSDTERMIAKIRELGIGQTPIFVLVKPYSREETIELGQHDNFFAFRNTDIYEAEFWDKINATIEITKQKLALKAEADNLSLRHLRQAYDHNYNDDNMLCGQDDNTKSVVEMMRLRLMQDPQLVKQEFDDAIRTKNPFCDFQDLEEISLDVYQSELEKIANLDDKGRDALDNEVTIAMGHERCRDGGILVRRIGLGDCYGFAYDPQTNGLMLVNDFGLHGYTKKFLAERISRIDGIKRRDFFAAYDEKYDIENRFISGLIVRVESLKTPLLLMHSCHGVSDEYMDLAIEFFKRQRRFIVVFHDMRLIPGQQD